MASDPLALGAVEMRDRLATGALRALEVAEAAIARVAALDPEVRAFAWFDPEHVRAQARRLDAWRATGAAIGPLHGVPVAVKDIIDTAGIPTENGTPIDAGRVPVDDAHVVRRLRAAGAVIFGKTATAEMAYLHPGPTANPAAPGRTPGGSSQGSAAAVAAGMVPLAVGTQTGGSVIRPAAFCGVTGFKPTFGAIPRTGILSQSPSLDTVGVFARDVTGAALLAEALFGDDPGDPATSPRPAPRLLETASALPPVPPLLAFVPPPGFDGADPATRDAFAELVRHLGERAFVAALPTAFDSAAEVRERINHAEMAKCYFAHERRGGERFSPVLAAAMATGRAILARDYIAALDWPDVLYAGLEEIFARCDAILTPAALGPAPEGLASTGSGVFAGLWTLARTPAISLPLLATEDGLPMGVQLVGPRGGDARLLRTATWLAGQLARTEETADA